MRSILALSALGFLLLAMPDRGAAIAPKIIQTHEAKVGDMVFIKLPGRPEYGYKWRLNPKMSDGLELVSVKVVGWLVAPNKNQKSQMNIMVTAKMSGEARLAFDYYRIREGRYDTHTSLVQFVVKP